MIRKYHNHKLQTNPWHREKGPCSNHETPGRQIKQNNQLRIERQLSRKTVKLLSIKLQILGKHSIQCLLALYQK